MMAEGWYKMLQTGAVIATPSPKTISRSHLWSLIYVYNDIRLLVLFIFLGPQYLKSSLNTKNIFEVVLHHVILITY